MAGDTKWNGANIHVGQGAQGGGRNISPSGQRQGYPGPNEPAFGRSQRGFIRPPAGDVVRDPGETMFDTITSRFTGIWGRLTGRRISEKNVRETLRITDRAYIVHDGAIFRSGTPDSLAADEDVRRIYLGTDFRLD